MMAMFDWLRPREVNPYSVERLKLLYANLLLAVDIANDNTLERRRHEQLLETLETVRSTSSPLQKPRIVRSVEIHDEQSTSRLATALKLISAVPSEGSDHGDAQAMRDENVLSCMAHVQKLELQLIILIRDIGELVAYGDKAGSAFRSDPVFEYFCEKCILGLLVEIAKSKPSSGSNLHAITWSPKVKAEIMRAISLLLSNAQDEPSLYYLLSKNYINELITFMIPLRQWTESGLEIMIPPYVKLLKSLVQHVAASPGDIYPFLKYGEHFPILSSSIDVAIFQRTDATSRSVCLTSIVLLFHTTHPHIRACMSSSESQMQALTSFVCTRLIDRYNQMGKLVMGPVVDHVRCNAMQIQLTDLKNQIQFLNELLQSGMQAFNVHFCEAFLRTVVSVLLENILPQKSRQFISVGIADMDVIPEPEGLAQVAVFFLVQFWSISFPPLARMLAVSLFHPNSTTLWKMAKYNAIHVEYALTRELNSIAQSTDGEYMDNPYRLEILNLLSGQRGEWRFIPASMLVEGALASAAVGMQLFVNFGLLPKDLTVGCPESLIDKALSTFILRKQMTRSAVVALALERASVTIVCIISQLLRMNSIKDVESFSLFHAMSNAHKHFCEQAMEGRKKAGVSDLFLDLTQASIRSRFPKVSNSNGKQMKHGLKLENLAFRFYLMNPTILIRRVRTIGSNDVEDCRFAIQMAILLRATLRVSLEPTNFPKISEGNLSLSTDWADDLLLRIGDLYEKPVVGTDLDLRGRMAFHFQTMGKSKNPSGKLPSPSHAILRPSYRLFLVLDPTDIFVVQVAGGQESVRGTIVCGVSLRKIIAFANDEEWLHLAIRNMDDVGSLIKNGNMALHFDNTGTSLIVKQYLERSQSIMRQQLKDQIEDLFNERFCYDRESHSELTIE
jgi:Uncharacterised conserved protein